MAKGIYISKTVLIVSIATVIILLVAEGLLVGLVGRPTCEPTTEPELPTSDPSKTTTAEPTTASTGAGELWENPRLSFNLLPKNYSVWLQPVLTEKNGDGEYIFNGKSSVVFTCNVSTNHVILHTAGLNYPESDLKENFVLTNADTGEVMELMEGTIYTINEYLVLTTSEPCEEGMDYNLTAKEFWGVLGDDLDGLYKSEYINEYGVNRVIATTQMQATGARKTFPCFDEPSFKATFVITLLHLTSDNYTAISNMPPEYYQSEIINSVQWNSTTFEPTPIMSTYLLAMVVSDFLYEEAFTSEETKEIQTRIYARSVPVKNGEVKYASDISPLILDVLADHFSVPYPLPKSDQLAVPDFGAGAMENWGLVIYRETYLLFDVNVTSVYSKYSVAQVIAHELAHQWFGNLVTCAWWSDLWLNEGFASFVQFIGVEGVHPNWKVDELFLVEDLQRALSSDSYSTSHPLHHPQGYFSTITYSKGASVLRMTQNFLGNDTFINGLTKYLEGQKYGVATYDVLFRYLAQQANDDSIELPTNLETILETWVLQMGYPLIKVVKNGTDLVLTQEYFLIDPDDQQVSTPGSDIYNYKWYVYLTYIEDLGQDIKSRWMAPDDPVTISSQPTFFLMNIDAFGFYRVHYDESLWATIIEKMNSPDYKEISTNSRAQLIDDIFALTRATKVPVEDALNLTPYLKQELEYVPWDTFDTAMIHFDRMLAPSTIYGDFTKYIANLTVESIYSEFGWDDSNTSDDLQIERMTRGLAINTACRYEHPECIEMAEQMYSDWMIDPEENMISTTYRRTVYCTAIKAGGVREWDFAWNRYLEVDSAQEKSNLRYALSCSKDPWIINRFIEYAQDSTLVRNQDISSTMSSIGSHEHSKYVAWSYAINHWETLTGSIGNGATNSMLNSAVRRFSSEFDLDLIENLKVVAGAVWNNTLNSYYNTVVDNIEWRERNQPRIKAWLNGEPAPASIKQKSIYTKYKNVENTIEEQKPFHKRF